MKIAIIFFALLISRNASCGKYIFRIKKDTFLNALTLRSYDIELLKIFGPKDQFYLVSSTINLSADEKKKLIKKLNLKYISNNEAITLPQTVSKPTLTVNWWHEQLDSKNAWKITEGISEVVVAVIDTGVDYHHQDLRANIHINKKEIPSNNIDDDQNGFIDDYYGYNFFSDHQDPIDDNGHGTHCAGIVAANGKIQGAAPGVKILPIKFLDNYGRGDIAKSILAIDYAIKRGAKILTNSYGTPNPNDALKEMIKYAEDKGVLFVAAAGNAKNDNDFRGEYPANFNLDNIISVAASASDKRSASFSNYGSMSVDLFAPGVGITSTDENNTYKARSGTSMATPFVAGAAALLWSIEPNLTPLEIKSRILNTSHKNRNLYGLSNSPGHLNLYSLLINERSKLDFPVDHRDILVKKASIQSDNPYENNAYKTYSIKVPSAGFIQLDFEYLDLEVAYDKIQIETKDGTIIDKFSGHFLSSKTIFYPHNELSLRIVSDHSGQDRGFKINKINYVE